MSLPVAMAIGLLLGIIAIVGVVAVVVWALGKKLGDKAKAGIYLLLLAYLALDWIRLRNFCAAEPTYIAPTAEEVAFGSDGTEVFNCDSAGGAMDHFYLVILGPGLIILMLVLFIRSLQRIQAEAFKTGRSTL